MIDLGSAVLTLTVDKTQFLNGLSAAEGATSQSLVRVAQTLASVSKISAASELELARAMKFTEVAAAKAADTARIEAQTYLQLTSTERVLTQVKLEESRVNTAAARASQEAAAANRIGAQVSLELARATKEEATSVRNASEAAKLNSATNKELASVKKIAAQTSKEEATALRLVAEANKLDSAAKKESAATGKANAQASKERATESRKLVDVNLKLAETNRVVADTERLAASAERARAEAARQSARFYAERATESRINAQRIMNDERAMATAMRQSSSDFTASANMSNQAFRSMADGVRVSFSSIKLIFADLVAYTLANSIPAALGAISTKIKEVVAAAADYQQEELTIGSLMAREIVTTQEYGDKIKTVAEALPIATDRAKEMMDELSLMSIVSPYMSETVQETFKLAMAFGYGADDARDFTKAILEVAAGSGASNERLQRMAYNFAQVRMQGKATAMDVRQLALAGFDLERVLQFVGEKYGVVVKGHEQFNEAIESGALNWDQFMAGFKEYAQLNFGGASERLAVSIKGIGNTIKDTFNLIVPLVFGPALWQLSEQFGRLLNVFITIRQSGALQNFGANLAAGVKLAFEPMERMIEYITKFSSMIGKGGTSSIGDFVSGAVRAGFGQEGVNKLNAILDIAKDILSIFGSIKNAALEIWGVLNPILSALGGISVSLLGIVADLLEQIFPAAGQMTLLSVAVREVLAVMVAIKALRFGLSLAEGIQAAITSFTILKGTMTAMNAEMAILGGKSSLAAVMTAAVNPIFLVVGAIAALVAGLVLLEQRNRAVEQSMRDQTTSIIESSKSYEDYYTKIMQTGKGQRVLSEESYDLLNMYSNAPEEFNRVADSVADMTQQMKVFNIFMDNIAIKKLKAEAMSLAEVNPVFADLARQSGLLTQAEYAMARGAAEARQKLVEAAMASGQLNSMLPDTAASLEGVRSVTFSTAAAFSVLNEEMAKTGKIKIANPFEKSERAIMSAYGTAMTEVRKQQAQADRDAVVTDYNNKMAAAKKLAEETKSANEKVAKDLESKMEAAFEKIKGYVGSMVDDAQGKLKGLMGDEGKTSPTDPGANGPFENIYRAADIAIKGAKSPWAEKLGLDQATAKKIVADFQNGLLSDQVKALIDIPALIDAVKMKAAADAIKAKFVEEIAKAAGTGTSVVQAIMGGDTTVQASNAASALATGLVEAVNANRSTFIGIGSSIAQTIVDGVVASKDIMNAGMAEVGTNMIEGVAVGMDNEAKNLDKASDVLFGGAVSHIRDELGVQSPSTVMAAIGVDMIQGLINGVGSMFESVKIKFGEAVTTITASFGDPLQILLGVGKSIIDGLLRGIQNGWQAMVDGVEALISTLPDAVKKILGIASPSKVFAAIGTMIPAGLAVGIQAASDDPILALKKIIDELSKISYDKTMRVKNMLAGFSQIFGEAFAALDTLKNFKPGNIENLSTFIAEIKAVMLAFQDLMSRYIMKRGDRTILRQIDDFGDATEDIVDGLVKAFEALRGLRKFKPGNVNNLDAFIREIKAVMGAAAAVLNSFITKKNKRGIKESLKEFGDALDDVFQGMLPAIDTITAIGKLEVPSDFNAKMLKFSNTLREMLRYMQSIGYEFKQKAVTSKAFAESVKEIIAVFASVIDVAEKVKGIKVNTLAAISSDLSKRIIEFVASVMDTFTLMVESDTSDLTVDDMAEYSEKVSSVLGPLSGIVDFWTKLRDFGTRLPSNAVITKAVTRIVENYTIIREIFSSLYTENEDNPLEKMEEYESNLQSMLGPLTSMIDFWNSLSEMVGGIPSKEKIRSIVSAIFSQYSIIYSEILFMRGSGRRKGSPDKIGNEVSDLVEDMGSVIAPLNAMLEFWKNIETMTSKPISVVQMVGIVKLMVSQYMVINAILWSEFNNPASRNKGNAPTETFKWDEKFNAILEPIQGMLDFWIKLNELEGSVPSNSFVSNIVKIVVDQFIMIANTLGQSSESLFALSGDAQKFGAAFESIFGGLKEAIDALKDMSTFARPAPLIVDMLMQSVRYIYERMSVLANSFDYNDSITNAFAETVGNVFGGLKSAIETIKEMYGMVNLPQGSLEWRVTNMIMQISIIMAAFRRYAIEESSRDWSPIVNFQKILVSVFDTLKTALDLFGQITSTTLPSWSHIETFIARIMYLYESLRRGIGGVEAGITSSLGSISSNAINASGATTEALSKLSKDWNGSSGGNMSIKNEKVIVIRFEGQASGAPMSARQFNDLKSQLYAAVRMGA